MVRMHVRMARDRMALGFYSCPGSRLNINYQGITYGSEGTWGTESLLQTRLGFLCLFKKYVGKRAPRKTAALCFTQLSLPSTMIFWGAAIKREDGKSALRCVQTCSCSKMFPGSGSQCS